MASSAFTFFCRSPDITGGCNTDIQNNMGYWFMRECIVKDLALDAYSELLGRDIAYNMASLQVAWNWYLRRSLGSIVQAMVRNPQETTSFIAYWDALISVSHRYGQLL